MNLILFSERSDTYTLAANDPRTRHIRTVLRMTAGDRLDVGVMNGPRGKATLTDGADGGLVLQTAWDAKLPPPPAPICLLIGLPRPQTVRKILKDATSLGLQQFCFFRAEKGEPSYADSKLWTSDEWQRLLIEGAEQAFSTDTPEVRHFGSLAEAIAALDPATNRAALDNYEATGAFADAPLQDPLALAIGSERGWSANERNLLRAEGFTLHHLGERVLRTETAVIAGLALAAAKLGFLR